MPLTITALRSLWESARSASVALAHVASHGSLGQRTALAGALLLAATSAGGAVHARIAEGNPATGSLALAINGEKLRAGDIVFRKGRSMASAAVVAVDRGSPYSHVGVLIRREGGWFVVSAMPLSRDGPSPVSIDALADFISDRDASAFAVYRVRATEGERLGLTAAVAAERLALSGATFDADFDLETDSALYCTELVWKVYLAAGLDIMDGHLDRVRGPFVSGLFVLPSSLQRSTALAKVDALTSDAR